MAAAHEAGAHVDAIRLALQERERWLVARERERESLEPGSLPAHPSPDRTAPAAETGPARDGDQRPRPVAKTRPTSQGLPVTDTRPTTETRKTPSTEPPDVTLPGTKKLSTTRNLPANKTSAPSQTSKSVSATEKLAKQSRGSEAKRTVAPSPPKKGGESGGDAGADGHAPGQRFSWMAFALAVCHPLFVMWRQLARIVAALRGS